MAIYKFRYFFSAGSGVCLWSDNDAAREKFDYPVDISKLTLSENLQRKALYIIAWCDTSLDWDYPSGPSPWSEEENARFDRAAQELYEELCEHLGNEFSIKNEFIG